MKWVRRTAVMANALNQWHHYVRGMQSIPIAQTGQLRPRDRTQVKGNQSLRLKIIITSS